MRIREMDVYRMMRRRAAYAGIKTKIGCHTFRATGITEYLRLNYARCAGLARESPRLLM
jgi:hypothetical protein